MNTATYVVLAAGPSRWTVFVAFIGGMIVAGALVWAVRVGMRYMDQEEPRPTSEDQPRMPDGGAVREMREIREPDEMPNTSRTGSRLMPYELHHSATRTGKDQQRKRWLPGSSGAFGSGGPGHV
ncbi:hypothetical protein ADK41_31700 [Streptomyces caelestis]|uniref:Secreted protein n=2 Tax=Streptomyces TaxID=1883 RepID=A0A0M9X619_9ACTN|nr:MULTISPECIES: DUF6479 family protein [Streptomyces]KOT30768.1 hypothetical protein ADK41_31700 [Streptomyces caelestis]KOV29031.1 hypothetical protein ADK58_10585 [Streptomyces sp. XY152]